MRRSFTRTAPFQRVRPKPTAVSVISEFLYHRQFCFKANPAWHLDVYGGARQAVTKILSLGPGGDQEEFFAAVVPTLGTKLSYQSTRR